MGNGEDALDAVMPVGQAPGTGAAPSMPTPVQNGPVGGDDALDRAMSHAETQAAAADNPKPKVDPLAVAQAAHTIHGSSNPQYTDSTPWSEVGAGFKKNAVPDLVNTAKGVAKGAYGLVKGGFNALASPVETGKDIYHFVAPQTPEQQSHRDAMVAATKAAGKGWLNHENQIWGTEGLLGGHTGGFKSAVANEPFSEVAMDASTLAGGAGLAARGAGLAKTANALSLASKAVDPIYGTLKAAKLAASPLVAGARKIQGLTTSVPSQFLKEAALSGASPNPQVRSAFLRHHWGTAPTDEPLKAVSDAFDTLKTNEFARLRGDKRLAYAANPGAVPFAPVRSAYDAAQRSLAGLPPEYATDIRDQLGQVGKLVDAWEKNPHLQTMENMDKLRNEVGRLQHADKSRFTEHLGPIYGAVRGAMEGVSPEYTKTLEQISEAQREFKDMARTMGVNAFDRGTAMTPTLLARQIRSQMSGRGREIMDKLSAIDPRIKPMLAGVATHEAVPHGMAGRILGGAGSLGIGSAFYNPATAAPLIGTGLAAIASSSPRLAGAMNYGYGALDRAANSLPVKGMYYAGRDNQQQTDTQALQPQDDGHFEKILGLESSGGKQFNKDGTTLRSPAGAIGASQIMPGTLKEAAEAAGEHPNLDRLMNDETYNKKLGKALFNKRLEEFGDPVAAAAAYNSNPATVHSAMKKARTTGGDWRDYLPDETKKYVRDFGEAKPVAVSMERAGRASGGRASINHASEAASLIRRAEVAKKNLGKSTEPLLNMPDEHIAKALSVANEAI